MIKVRLAMLASLAASGLAGCSGDAPDSTISVSEPTTAGHLEREMPIGLAGVPLGELVEVKFSTLAKIERPKRPSVIEGTVILVRGHHLVEPVTFRVKIAHLLSDEFSEVTNLTGASFVGYETGEFVGVSTSTQAKVNDENGLYASWAGDFRYERVFVIVGKP